MRRIVLGSTSPYRRALMEKLGIAFEVAKPLLDEEKAKVLLQQDKASPLEIAQTLARLKVESLKNKNDLIIGGDQLVQLDGQILGKPHTFEKAVEQLEKMKNKTHEIITAVCVSTAERNYEFYDIAKLTMKNLLLEEIEDYVRKDQPLDCAGSYKIEKQGKNLFSRIEAEDFSAIEGLPLIKLSHLLQTLGYETKKI
jgi:septum formation protein